MVWKRKTRSFHPRKRELLLITKQVTLLPDGSLSMLTHWSKVSIVPRGVAALGYAQYLPKEQFLYTALNSWQTACVWQWARRVAEDIVFGKISTGAQNDLGKDHQSYLTRMVTIYGMNKVVGNVSFHDPHNEYNFNKPYSEKTSEMIDNEVRILISRFMRGPRNCLHEKRRRTRKN